MSVSIGVHYFIANMVYSVNLDYLLEKTDNNRLIYGVLQ